MPQQLRLNAAALSRACQGIAWQGKPVWGVALLRPCQLPHPCHAAHIAPYPNRTYKPTNWDTLAETETVRGPHRFPQRSGGVGSDSRRGTSVRGQSKTGKYTSYWCAGY